MNLLVLTSDQKLNHNQFIIEIYLSSLTISTIKLIGN